MDDLISRQMASDALKERRALYCDNTPASFSELSFANKSRVDELDTVIATLVNLPSAQPEPQWIPVTKKAHPDLPIRVQVQIDNGWIITAYYQECEWLSVPDCGEPLQVEAWRELPEPYTERREE